MFRLVSLLGLTCLAVAAVALAAQTPPSSPEYLSQDEEPLETSNRLPRAMVAVALPVCPAFHARFSLN